MAQYARCAAIDISDTFLGREQLGYFKNQKAKGERKKYVAAITDVLDEINGTLLGKRLFASLAKHGQPIVISMPDYAQVLSHRQKCSSSATAKSTTSDAFRRPDLAANALGAQAELLKAIRKNGAGYEAIAKYINDAFAATGLLKQSVTAQDLKDLFDVDPSTMAPGVERNRKFAPLIDFPFGYYLKAAVERDLPHGLGAGSTVRFDPWNDLGGTRKLDVGLFHELVHAWHNASGRKLFTDDHKENELMTIGINPFEVRHTGHRRLYTENAYRAERGLSARMTVD